LSGVAFTQRANTAVSAFRVTVDTAVPLDVLDQPAKV
jgi:hypothetical protein